MNYHISLMFLDVRLVIGDFFSFIGQICFDILDVGCGFGLLLLAVLLVGRCHFAHTF
jgi:hypothetical protein